jgi:hypothetical protein
VNFEKLDYQICQKNKVQFPIFLSFLAWQKRWQVQADLGLRYLKKNIDF